MKYTPVDDNSCTVSPVMQNALKALICETAWSHVLTDLHVNSPMSTQPERLNSPNFLFTGHPLMGKNQNSYLLHFSMQK